MASLAALLDDGEGDEEAGNELALGFPTSALAVFAYDGDWPTSTRRRRRVRSWRYPASGRGADGRPRVRRAADRASTTPASRSAASISSREMPSR